MSDPRFEYEQAEERTRIQMATNEIIGGRDMQKEFAPIMVSLVAFVAAFILHMCKGNSLAARTAVRMIVYQLEQRFQMYDAYMRDKK